MRILPLLLLTACAEGQRPNGAGEYDLGDGYSLHLWSASGDGRCDLFLPKDHPDMSGDDHPGFCTATGQIHGPEPRWLLFRDLQGQVLPEYADERITLRYAGSDNGDTTNIRIAETPGVGPYSAELVWGDEGDPDTWQSVLVVVKARRYTF